MTSMSFTIRQASLADAEQIAVAHLDSIHSLGAKGYPPDVMSVWGAPRDGGRYRSAMEAGEVFFVAVTGRDAADRVLGFSSHRVEQGQHRTAVYVRGSAARMGIGTALFRAAEAVALEQSANEIHVDASIVAREFYQAQGFRELSRGQHCLPGDIQMDCVFMKKAL